MPKFTVPTEVLDTEVGSRDDTFPEGTWEGVIEIVRVREVHADDGEGPLFFLQDKQGNYFAQKCELASIQYGTNTAVLEGQPNIGAMKYFDDNFILSFDDVNWDEYQREDGDPRWQLGLTQTRLTRLAKALGLTEVEGDGEGPVDHFDELVRDTDEGRGLNGMGVRYKVFHRKFKKRDGTDGKQAQIGQYYPAGS